MQAASTMRHNDNMCKNDVENVMQWRDPVSILHDIDSGSSSLKPFI